MLIGIRFDQLLCRRAFEADPSFRWCTNPKCDAGQIVTNGGISHISLPQDLSSLTRLQARNSSSPVQPVGITPATAVNLQGTDIKPASKSEPKEDIARKTVLRRAGLKRTPRHVIPVDDIARKLMGAIISSVLVGREVVGLNGVGFVGRSMMILGGKGILLIRRLASIMLDHWVNWLDLLVLILFGRWRSHRGFCWHLIGRAYFQATW